MIRTFARKYRTSSLSSKGYASLKIFNSSRWDQTSCIYESVRLRQAGSISASEDATPVFYDLYNIAWWFPGPWFQQMAYTVNGSTISRSSTSATMIIRTWHCFTSIRFKWRISRGFDVCFRPHWTWKIECQIEFWRAIDYQASIPSISLIFVDFQGIYKKLLPCNIPSIHIYAKFTLERAEQKCPDSVSVQQACLY